MQNRHQIDIIVSDTDGRPVILVEPKWLRYKKHNWDKGSRLCIAHHSLRRSYPSIRKSIGVLAGEWTDASLEFIRSFGVEVHRIPFDHVADALGKHGVPFRWAEKDTRTQSLGWQAFEGLSPTEREQLAVELTTPVVDAVKSSVSKTLQSDPGAPKRIESVEILIRTKDGEYLVYPYPSVQDAMQGLIQFTRDVDDVRSMIKH
jgi:hypothetical protein